jgi:hypothetical protein
VQLSTYHLSPSPPKTANANNAGFLVDPDNQVAMTTAMAPWEVAPAVFPFVLLWTT